MLNTGTPVTTRQRRALTGRNFRTEVTRLIRRELDDATASVVFSSKGIRTRSFIGKGDGQRWTNREVDFLVYRSEGGLTHWVARATTDPQGAGDLRVIQTR